MNELGGNLWVLVTILGPVIFALAMIYAIFKWRRRSPAQGRAGDEQTRRLYQSGQDTDRV